MQYHALDLLVFRFYSFAFYILYFIKVFELMKMSKYQPVLKPQTFRFLIISLG